MQCEKLVYGCISWNIKRSFNILSRNNGKFLKWNNFRHYVISARLCNMSFKLFKKQFLKNLSFSVCLYLQLTVLLISKNKCNFFFHKYVYSYFTEIIWLIFKNRNILKEVVIIYETFWGKEKLFWKILRICEYFFPLR